MPLSHDTHPEHGSDRYGRCRDCGSRKIEGIADAHAVGLVGANGQLRDVTRFEESEALVDRGSLICAACGSWNVRPPAVLR